MKNWILFITLLISNPSQVLSCASYYPYGDYLRFTLLEPKMIQLRGMNHFFYCADLYSNEEMDVQIDHLENSDENVNLWYAFFQNKIEKKAIYEAVYHLSITEMYQKKHSNKLVQLLHQKKYRSAFSYLIFAKKCSVLNGEFSDPWERNESYNVKIRRKFIIAAIQRAGKEKNDQLKRRFAYLAIRMAYYSFDSTKIALISNQYFKKAPSDVIDYWALHFKNASSPNSIKRNIDIARVFLHSQEKRFASHFLYDSKKNMQDQMKEAKNNDEKAAVLLINCVRKLDPALPEIKLFQKYAPNDPNLMFLVHREINKLEDWIFTPYYSLLEPTTNTYSNETASIKTIRSRIKKDRLYAKQLAIWMQSVEKDVKDTTGWWSVMKKYAQYMSDDYSLITQKSKDELLIASKNKELQKFRLMLYSLIEIRQSKLPNLTNETVQQTILSNSKELNNRFLFAIGRELEFKGNTTDAACLFSYLNNDFYYDTDNYAFWRSEKFHQTLEFDYYDNYFFYMDAQYSIPATEQLLIALNDTISTSNFDQWKFQLLRKNRSRIYDLLGTKYLRKDNLEMALKSYQHVKKSVWDSDLYPYKRELKTNPFHPPFNYHSKDNQIRYNKKQIVEKLIQYKNKIELKKGNSKAYYCFRVATCYFNMTQYGKSWLMKRYYWTISATPTGLEDDKEYFNCLLAKKYFLKAYHSTKNRKLKALSLRMLDMIESVTTDGNEKYKNQLRKNFPDDYEPLTSNCDALTSYYSQFKP